MAKGVSSGKRACSSVRKSPFRSLGCLPAAPPAPGSSSSEEVVSLSLPSDELESSLLLLLTSEQDTGAAAALPTGWPRIRMPVLLNTSVSGR